MGDVVDLSVVRSQRSDDAKDWSVLDALNDTVKKIEAGELNPWGVYIGMAEDKDGGGLYVWAAAGLTDLELVGFLERHKKMHV